ncbi:fibronectin type III domain-containing protein [Neolewinella antarctica]|uniref:Fibronectin type-III domain-containing protein n=1 Tax=Neolewinella antarctica TaxID=442734 RepID=A0ABX0XFN6_9BACT|nr:hypothetical protein [Neolewinella antarctica]NJC27696.1 hypothetical protein [Neolewinella antarctica]
MYSALRQDGQIYVRWAPQNGPAFRQLLDGGLTVEIYTITNGGLGLVETLQPRALSLSDYLATAINNYDSVAIAHLYYFDLAGEDWEDMKDEEIPDIPLAERDNELLLNHNYSTVHDWRTSVKSGQGRALARDAVGEGIAVKIYPTPSGDTLYYQRNLIDYEPPSVPELKGQFNNQRVKLQWRHYDMKEAYWGWFVEKSVNGGAFVDITSGPYMYATDITEETPEALKSLYRTDAIVENNVPITYRLRGQDFLGFRSEVYSELTGEGFEDVKYSPGIQRSIQTDSNYAVLQWTFDEAQEPYVDYFRIIVTDSVGGTPVTALDEIGADVREAAVPMKYRSNFYRVQVITKTGRTISSFESLVMAFDATPPAVPRDFAGYIDSVGIAHFTWTPTNEPDLAGYYLFKGYYDGTELAMITPDPLPGPEFVDTVNMVTPNEHVFYQLRSVDTRGNGSGFSPKLKLKKPDVYPPVAPQFRRGEAGDDGIELSWVSSPSEDVVSYELLREVMDGPAAPISVLTFDTSAYRGAFVDPEVEPDVVYRYFIRAIDDDGLVSDNSQPVTVEMSDFGLRAPIENITISAQPDANTITLDWEYAAAPSEFYLYRGEGEEPVVLLKALAGADRQFVDQAVKAGRRYRYLMQAIFRDGGVSPFSSEVETVVE